MRYLSLFSGMEAAHLAWSPIGWSCVGVAEIEPAACALLRHRLPTVPNLGSVLDITDANVQALGRIDVVIGGSPCQDLSVAGKRAGLAGRRSSLFHQQLRIFNAARTLCGARWLVWENVPGAFSSNEGRDFAVVVGALAGCDIDVPGEGWGNEGVALGDNGLVEWSVLDAQWFGVAQRRRRVFAVLDAGSWTDRAPVLLERDSMRGDSAPRREAGERPASTLVARAGSGSGPGIRAEVDGGVGLIPAIARCVTTGEAKRQDWETCTIIPTVAHTLRADGFDASEDGTGRGTPLIPVPFDTTQITNPDNRSAPKEGDPCHPLAASAHPPAIAFDCKASGQSGFGIGEVASTMRAMGHADSHQNGGGHLAVAVAMRGREGGAAIEVGDDCGFTLRASQGGSDKAHVMAGMQVRRLTPRECERLQGAPDDWTAVPVQRLKNKRVTKLRPEERWVRDGDGWLLLMADGPRYKMLGNSFAVPVIRWIGQRIQVAAESSLDERSAA